MVHGMVVESGSGDNGGSGNAGIGSIFPLELLWDSLDLKYDGFGIGIGDVCVCSMCMTLGVIRHCQLRIILR